MKLVISEKPSVAMSIAKVLKAREKHDGYISGNGWIISWCVGHLIGLCDAAEYDKKYKYWRYEDLPIVPDKWKDKVLGSTKKQFEILKKLMHRRDVTEVICATDAGREGELIFRLVYGKAGCKKPVKRLWISSMEEIAIKKGFEELRDGSEFDALYASALCRAKADWLVGINASRLFSVLYRKNLKVGRVQTPTLAMLVERNQRITDFVKEKYYVTHLTCMDMDAVSEHFKTREEAETVAEACQNQKCEVIKDEVTVKTVNPPRLYDLTTLQREANRIFGYTAQETLDAVQRLYEKKFVTYPRTDSQYLTDDMKHSTEELLKCLKDKMPFYNENGCTAVPGHLLDSKKVSDHHAIIPTMESVRKSDAIKMFNQMERMIFYMICTRLYAAMGEKHIYETHKCEITCNDHVFHINVKYVKQEGFRETEKAFYQFIGRKEKEEKSIEIYLGKQFGLCTTEVKENYTKPPLQYTEDTLLSAMEHAGNDEVSDDTEKRGIGTPATRAAIIEKLIQSGFVKREKKSLIPTDEGNKLVTILPDEIKSAKMTAEWEMQLNRIAKGEERTEVFLDGITDMLHELIGRYHGVIE